MEELGDRTYKSWCYASRGAKERFLKEYGLYEYKHLLDSTECLARKMQEKAKQNRREYIIW